MAPTLPGAGAGARHSGRLMGHLGRRMLGFYLIGDGILGQKNIRVDTVFREHMYNEQNRERQEVERSKYDEGINFMLAASPDKRKPRDEWLLSLCCSLLCIISSDPSVTLHCSCQLHHLIDEDCKVQII